MKITKKRLQEIVLEEMRTLKEYTGPGKPPDKTEEPQEEPQKLDKAAARAGAKSTRAKGTGMERDVGAMTPVEGGIEARLQAIHDELVNPGEIAGASRIRQLLDNIMKMLDARGGQQ